VNQHHLLLYFVSLKMDTTTDQTMIEEEPLKDKSSRGGLRQSQYPRQAARLGHRNITNLQAVAEIHDENNSDLIASKSSFDGMSRSMCPIFHEAKLDESESTDYRKDSVSVASDDHISSSSSSDKRRVSDQFRSFETGSCESLVSDTKKSQSTDQYDSSFSSRQISKSSRDSEDSRSHAISNMGLLGEFEDPPTNIFQGSKDGNDVSGSFLSMTSLADFTTEKFNVYHSLASMPSLGEIHEEEVIENSVSSFVTGSSGNDSFRPGKSIFKILEEEATFAGTTLDGLAPPAFQQNKPTLQRWSSDEAAKPGVEEAIRIVEDLPPRGKLEGEISSSLDQPPRAVKRQLSLKGRYTLDVAPMPARVADPLNIATLENTDMPPMVARRHESDELGFLEDE
jgi:hypothetical protein